MTNLFVELMAAERSGYPPYGPRDQILKYEMFVDQVWDGDIQGDGPKGLTCTWRDWSIMTCGLGGEAGEVLEKCKKYIRDGNGDVELIKKELGDVLYYLTKIAHTFNMTLVDVMDGNIKKLENRVKNNTLHGDGDNR